MGGQSHETLDALEKEALIPLGDDAKAIVTENTVTVTATGDGVIVTHRFVWEDGQLRVIEFESTTV